MNWNANEPFLKRRKEPKLYWHSIGAGWVVAYRYQGANWIFHGCR
jgi:hypothetical protein